MIDFIRKEMSYALCRLRSCRMSGGGSAEPEYWAGYAACANEILSRALLAEKEENEKRR